MKGIAFSKAAILYLEISHYSELADFILLDNFNVCMALMQRCIGHITKDYILVEKSDHLDHGLVRNSVDRMPLGTICLLKSHELNLAMAWQIQNGESTRQLKNSLIHTYTYIIKFKNLAKYLFFTIRDKSIKLDCTNRDKLI